MLSYVTPFNTVLFLGFCVLGYLSAQGGIALRKAHDRCRNRSKSASFSEEQSSSSSGNETSPDNDVTESDWETESGEDSQAAQAREPDYHRIQNYEQIEELLTSKKGSKYFGELVQDKQHIDEVADAVIAKFGDQSGTVEQKDLNDIIAKGIQKALETSNVGWLTYFDSIKNFLKTLADESITNILSYGGGKTRLDKDMLKVLLRGAWVVINRGAINTKIYKESVRSLGLCHYYMISEEMRERGNKEGHRNDLARFDWKDILEQDDGNDQWFYNIVQFEAFKKKHPKLFDSLYQEILTRDAKAKKEKEDRKRAEKRIEAAEKAGMRFS